MLKEILEVTFLQNSVLDYLIFLLTILVGILIVRIIKALILRRLKAWAEKTATTIDDFLIRIFEKTLLPLVYFGVLYLATRSLTLNPTLTKIIDVLGVILLTIFGIRFVVSIIKYSLETYWLKKEKDEAKQRSVKGILKVIKVIIWGIGITFLLDNLGFKISTVIAGLGIGGIAVALAAQAILGDLFSYMSILFDRPFEIGDFIIVGDYLGTIEHIGIKTTRVRSLSGEQLVFSNTDLTNSRLRNYKRMGKRRVLFKLGVTYQTSLQQLKEIPEVIKNIIENIDDTTFDRSHFSSYGDFSLDFETVYYVMNRDYNKYMNIQQEINFAINEEFEKRRIEFAYPTQTLYLSKT
ncbi:MAG: mechanosensitive ion channel protein MscS [candidate division Zixibacteria bacterium SM23_73_3]|nr:MAG: mechanosensitive ion channel protein MscS [candidate division Zixibacteria bacterium SM23_73_3]